MAGNIFGKMAADTLGISDIGKIIDPSEFNKVDGDDYIMHEDGEKIYFVIKSKTDEYVFTNRGISKGRVFFTLAKKPFASPNPPRTICTFTIQAPSSAKRGTKRYTIPAIKTICLTGNPQKEKGFKIPFNPSKTSCSLIE